jgi:hypothetical protein
MNWFAPPPNPTAMIRDLVSKESRLQEREERLTSDLKLLVRDVRSPKSAIKMRLDELEIVHQSLEKVQEMLRDMRAVKFASDLATMDANMKATQDRMSSDKQRLIQQREDAKAWEDPEEPFKKKFEMRKMMGRVDQTKSASQLPLQPKRWMSDLFSTEEIQKLNSV